MNSDGLAKLTQMLNSTTPNALSAALKALIAIAKTNGFQFNSKYILD
jgi:hypothetical protein